MQTSIIYEDAHVVVVNKPAHINVVLGYGREHEKTLLHLIAEKSQKAIYPVHRLDRNTSGVLIMAKDKTTKDFLQKQFKDRSVKKEYLTLVKDVPKHPSAKLDWPIGRSPKNPLKQAVRPQGKPAQTLYTTEKIYHSKLDPYKKYALLKLQPITGRTHQIRVHLAKLGHPIIGDKQYGRPLQVLNRHWLHASKITFKLPNGTQKTFTSPLPDELADFLKSLKAI